MNETDDLVGAWPSVDDVRLCLEGVPKDWHHSLLGGMVDSIEDIDRWHVCLLSPSWRLKSKGKEEPESNDDLGGCLTDDAGLILQLHFLRSGFHALSLMSSRSDDQAFSLMSLMTVLIPCAIVDMMSKRDYKIDHQFSKDIVFVFRVILEDIKDMSQIDIRFPFVIQSYQLIVNLMKDSKSMSKEASAALRSWICSRGLLRMAERIRIASFDHPLLLWRLGSIYMCSIRVAMKVALPQPLTFDAQNCITQCNFILSDDGFLSPDLRRLPGLNAIRRFVMFADSTNWKSLFYVKIPNGKDIQHLERWSEVEGQYNAILFNLRVDCEIIRKIIKISGDENDIDTMCAPKMGNHSIIEGRVSTLFYDLNNESDCLTFIKHGGPSDNGSITIAGESGWVLLFLVLRASKTILQRAESIKDEPGNMGCVFLAYLAERHALHHQLLVSPISKIFSMLCQTVPTYHEFVPQRSLSLKKDQSSFDIKCKRARVREVRHSHSKNLELDAACRSESLDGFEDSMNSFEKMDLQHIETDFLSALLMSLPTIMLGYYPRYMLPILPRENQTSSQTMKGMLNGLLMLSS
eukprot:GHVH01001614.1.p1 GENE.GHVH01001614.1~~GHVH01001614.1.p1  ORF type:complete len:576 (+),score=70.70 GHVH01001614.1:45-1772(+)